MGGFGRDCPHNEPPYCVSVYAGISESLLYGFEASAYFCVHVVSLILVCRFPFFFLHVCACVCVRESDSWVCLHMHFHVVVGG